MNEITLKEVTGAEQKIIFYITCRTEDRSKHAHKYTNTFESVASFPSLDPGMTFLRMHSADRICCVREKINSQLR